MQNCLFLMKLQAGLDPVVRDEILDVFNDFTRDENHSIFIFFTHCERREKLCVIILHLCHKGCLLLCEEKDELLNNYCIAQCDESRINKIDKYDILSVPQIELPVECSD